MMKKIIVLFAILLVSPWATLAREPSLGDIQLATQKRVLDNGLTVLVTEMPQSSSVSLYALCQTGSATEGKFLGTGISHFLEHMLFKGTEKRAMGAISKDVQALGGTINATTSLDTTYYVLTVPYEKFPQALEILSDMIKNAKFDPAEIEKEREVVINEMRLYKDNPDRRFYELIYKTGFLRHPYRVPVIGYEELLRPLTRDDFLEYYQQKYAPNNMVFSVAGNLKSQEAFTNISQAFQGFPRQREVTRNLPQEPTQISPRHYEESYPTQLTRMAIAYQGVSILNEDMFAMDVLAMILGQGESSRLYEDLFKKQKLVHSITTVNDTPLDPGFFVIKSVLENKDVPLTLKAVRDQIAAIKKNGVRPDELKKSKRQVLSDYLNDLETPEDVAYTTAVNEAITGDYHFSRKYIQGVSRVTDDDIKRVARKYLVEERESVVVLKPETQESLASEQAGIFQVSEIKKIVLDNGLTVLLRENHSLPLVSMTLAMDGGTRYEPQDLLGLSQLTSQLWTKGTSKRDAQELAQTIESRGMDLNSFSGRNSMGITLECISQDLDVGMELVEEIFKSPAFDEKELLKEKDKLKTAISARDDDIFRVTAKALNETLFPNHPLGKDSLGTKDSVDRLSRQDIVSFYQSVAVPQRIVISVFGDFSSENIEPKIKERFSDLPRKELSAKPFPAVPPESTLTKTLYLDKKQAVIMIGFQGAGFSSPDRYGLEVLAGALGSSMNGKIFKKIREDFGESYALGGSFVPSWETGMIYFYVMTKEASAAQVQDLLQGIFRDVRDNPLTADELNDVKTYLKGTFQMGLDTNSSLGFMTALDELYGLGFDRYRKYPDAIDKVTSNDIRELAVKYLNWDKAAVVVTLPKASSTDK